MGFSYAGNLGGAGAPVVRRLQSGETCYTGQFLMSGRVGGLGGHVQLADVATDTFEDEQPLIGFVSAVADKGRTYTAKAADHEYGDISTYHTTIATVLANQGTGLTGGPEVDVTLALPMQTLIRSNIWNVTFGETLLELVETTGDADGTEVAHSETVITAVDDLCTIYCRSGANKGHYRVVTTGAVNKQIVTVPFPHTIDAGDVFVVASCVLGLGGLDFTTYIDGIDGNNVLDDYYSVYYHEINLEESGKEYAIFSLWPQSVEATTAS